MQLLAHAGDARAVCSSGEADEETHGAQQARVDPLLAERPVHGVLRVVGPIPVDDDDIALGNVVSDRGTEAAVLGVVEAGGSGGSQEAVVVGRGIAGGVVLQLVLLLGVERWVRRHGVWGWVGGHR